MRIALLIGSRGWKKKQEQSRETYDGDGFGVGEAGAGRLVPVCELEGFNSSFPGRSTPYTSGVHGKCFYCGKGGIGERWGAGCVAVGT